MAEASSVKRSLFGRILLRIMILFVIIVAAWWLLLYFAQTWLMFPASAASMPPWTHRRPPRR